MRNCESVAVLVSEAEEVTEVLELESVLATISDEEVAIRTEESADVLMSALEAVRDEVEDSVLELVSVLD
jgi:hypothetical protein